MRYLTQIIVATDFKSMSVACCSLRLYVRLQGLERLYYFGCLCCRPWPCHPPIHAHASGVLLQQLGTVSPWVRGEPLRIFLSLSGYLEPGIMRSVSKLGIWVVRLGSTTSLSYPMLDNVRYVGIRHTRRGLILSI